MSHQSLDERDEHEENDADGDELAVVVAGARLASGASIAADRALTTVLRAASRG